MARKYKKVRYYRIHVQFSREDKYDIFLKGNGLTSEEALDKAIEDKLFKDDMDSQYVKRVDEITRDDFKTETPYKFVPKA